MISWKVWWLDHWKRQSCWFAITHMNWLWATLNYEWHINHKQCEDRDWWEWQSALHSNWIAKANDSCWQQKLVAKSMRLVEWCSSQALCENSQLVRSVWRQELWRRNAQRNWNRNQGLILTRLLVLEKILYHHVFYLILPVWHFNELRMLRCDMIQVHLELSVFLHILSILNLYEILS